MQLDLLLRSFLKEKKAGRLDVPSRTSFEEKIRSVERKPSFWEVDRLPSIFYFRPNGNITLVFFCGKKEFRIQKIAAFYLDR